MTRFTVLLALYASFLLVSPRANAVPFGSADSANRYDTVGRVSFSGGFASGVLIAPNVVLTAAHVVEDVLGGGAGQFFTGVSALAPDTVTALAGGVRHPQYDAISISFDIGLLFLAAPVLLPAYATLLPDAPATLIGDDGTVVGYGGSTFMRRTAGFDIDIVSGGQVLLESDGTPVGGAVVEGGDSGGGLFVQRGGEDVLVGLTSFSVGSISGFASVSALRPFIDTQVAGVAWFGEVQAMPEPAALLVMLFGLTGMGVVIRRRR